jgi:creatinine amidohydrolase
MMFRRDPRLMRDPVRVELVPLEPASRGWVTRERSGPGHTGDPRRATPAKGEALFRLFADDVCALLHRVLVWGGRGLDG